MDAETFETIFRTILSTNQLSIHGAVADLCDEFEIQVGPDKTHVVEDLSESTLTGRYKLHMSPANDLERRNLVHNYQQRLQNLSDEAQLIQSSTDAGVFQNRCFLDNLYDEGR